MNEHAKRFSWTHWKKRNDHFVIKAKLQESCNVLSLFRQRASGKYMKKLEYVFSLWFTDKKQNCDQLPPPPTDHVKECEEEMKAKKDQSDGGKL